jgi:hypothetical protein
MVDKYEKGTSKDTDQQSELSNQREESRESSEDGLENVKVTLLNDQSEYTLEREGIEIDVGFNRIQRGIRVRRVRKKNN